MTHLTDTAGEHLISDELLGAAMTLGSHLLDLNFSRHSTIMMIDTCKTVGEMVVLLNAIDGKQSHVCIVNDAGVSQALLFGYTTTHSSLIDFVGEEKKAHIVRGLTMEGLHLMPTSALESAIDLRTDRSKALTDYLLDS